MGRVRVGRGRNRNVNKVPCVKFSKQIVKINSSTSENTECDSLEEFKYMGDINVIGFRKKISSVVQDAE